MKVSTLRFPRTGNLTADQQSREIAQTVRSREPVEKCETADLEQSMQQASATVQTGLNTIAKRCAIRLNATIAHRASEDRMAAENIEQLSGHEGGKMHHA